MSKVYIGIDLAAKCCWGAARNQEGELLNTERFKTSEENLIAYVKSQGGEATVLMEECDLAGWAQRVLAPHAQKVAVCEPRANLWIHRDAVKTDKIDAKKLAQIAHMGNYKEVYHTPGTRGSTGCTRRLRPTSGWWAGPRRSRTRSRPSCGGRA